MLAYAHTYVCVCMHMFMSVLVIRHVCCDMSCWTTGECRDIRRDICLFSPNMYMRDSVRQSDLCVSAIGIADCVLSCMFLGFQCS